MTIYIGGRLWLRKTGEQTLVESGTRVLRDGRPLSLPAYIREAYGNQFAWGYSGSGPQALCEAILMREFGASAPPEAWDVLWPCVQSFPRHEEPQQGREGFEEEWRVDWTVLLADMRKLRDRRAVQR